MPPLHRASTIYFEYTTQKTQKATKFQPAITGPQHGQSSKERLQKKIEKCVGGNEAFQNTRNRLPQQVFLCSAGPIQQYINRCTDYRIEPTEFRLKYEEISGLVFDLLISFKTIHVYKDPLSRKTMRQVVEKPKGMRLQ